jgi:hypothetical protein
MTHQNTLRTPLSPEARRAGIHLVYSRDWQLDRRTPPKPQLVAVRHTRERQTVDTISLAAAAFTAPFVWIGHAILHAMHIL